MPKNKAAPTHELSRDRLWTTQEVAEYLRLSKKAVYNLVENKELPCSRILSRLRFNPRDIEMFVRSRRTTGATS